ncbi:hypothetical protein Ddye_031236 [Dipteronia dyeriana]|uniref:Protein kinase domain-containing protein n=1 Tax=Dipteronia dyeriana TaxID=168575 RepID=A0AAD9THX4_9ROSI|nr:hypothetical protein Ddye_031236 [Dipteronia dyeriana]
MALLVSSSVYVLIFLTVLNFTLSRTSGTKCNLDIQLSATNNSNCGSGSWGGFINNSNCCTSSFDDYLYALGRRANLTGDIFLNATEQKSCLMSMKEFKSNVLGCGIEKLTAGAGGCSDYTVEDTFSKLGDRLKTLDEDCKGLSSFGRSDQACIACLRRWEEIGGSSDDEVENVKAEADVCRYAVLVTLTGSRIDNAKWVQAVFDCLRQQPLVIGLVILVGSIVGISSILLIAALILFKKGTKNSLSTGKDAFHESLSDESSYLKITIKEVYLATNNLSTSNFIGQGVAGKVYKGKISNGQHVAVKHITDDGYVETFVREVRSLSHVQHPNLVALLGHCEDNDDCFLVYELCHNGNLSEWLYSKDRVLSWIQRLEIAIDCARGLWFLHTYPEGLIVHRDIKPTNILIDADFQAKLSDFGLSKVMDIGQSCVISEVRGTFGYVDPEYRRNHHVSASGDVYSFGIVLLQLLSGQRVINLNIDKPMPLDKMAKFLMRGGDIAEFADPKLNGEYSFEAFDFVLKLALSCAELKQQRPSMGQVVLNLEKALDISNTTKPCQNKPHTNTPLK